MITVSHVETNFTMVSNNICRSKDLNPFEKAVVIYLISLPQNTSIRLTSVYKNIGITNERGARTIKTLEKNGYITKVQTTDGEGKFTGLNIIINQNPKNTKNGISDTRNSGTRNLYNTSNNNTSKKLLSSESNYLHSTPKRDTVQPKELELMSLGELNRELKERIEIENVRYPGDVPNCDANSYRDHIKSWFSTIPQTEIDLWVKRYRTISVGDELVNAYNWLLDFADSKRKKKIKSFLIGWLRRAEKRVQVYNKKLGRNLEKMTKPAM